MRNYVVLNIVVDEARIFKTKERAPTMLCIECYRPVELSLEKVPNLIKNEMPEVPMTSSSAENPVIQKGGLAPIRTSSDVQDAEDEVDFNLLVTSTRNKSMSFNMSRAGANDGLFPFATDLHAQAVDDSQSYRNQPKSAQQAQKKAIEEEKKEIERFR